MKKAIIIDLDGTLCNVDHRVKFVEQNPKDWSSFNAGIADDKINQWCFELIRLFRQDGYSIVLLTGRLESLREKSIAWLDKYGVSFDELFMRADNDRGEDFEIKKKIFEQKISPDYEVLFVVEDRKSVVKMWRDIGVPCLQCDWGDF